ncbi:HAD family acid phosphatase [Lacipirellula sp.]|uniref:HAD family acid phosphatase n=1 Tax=Lacipirellula sp. TaxID=2691419 RepID=UPI003D14B9E7
MGAAAASENFNFGFPTPGPQEPTPQQVLDHVFFSSETGWKAIREKEQFDYVVVGSGFCALAFVERTLEHEPGARILVLERGPFFLPEHFQNLPLPYQQTLGGLSETFPWTLSAKTAQQPAGKISWQHGMVPFFGGRSILWSAWCPRPTDDEMAGWSLNMISAARRNFEDAERLLNVVSADKIDEGLDDAGIAMAARRRPIYGTMQRALQAQVAAKLQDVGSATRSMAAPIAVGAGVQEDLDFAKFSTPAPLLDLAMKQARLAETGEGSPLRVVCNVRVERIVQEDGVATALKTSRGVVNLRDARVILAMGALPPATLLMNSFPELPLAGQRFTAHFISSIVARIPRADFPFADELAAMELAAIYIAGKSPDGMQYHIQLSVLSDTNPAKNARRAARYMPDVVATASPEQIQSSPDHLIFVCAALGELDHRNPDSWMKLNDDDDPTTNVLLQILANENDEHTWKAMDEGAFNLLEKVLSPKGKDAVEYWHGTPHSGEWTVNCPSEIERRVPALVHEGSSLWMDDVDGKGVVGADYRPHGVKNVYVTGAGLWPKSGSWNPTLTMTALAQDLADQLRKEMPPLSPGYLHHNNVDAMLWQQASAELEACVHQAYAIAKMRIAAAMSDADPEKRYCITTDLDETLFDNSAYNESLVALGRNFNERGSWARYCLSMQSKLLPSVAEFYKWLAADHPNLRVFFVTSRREEVRAATVQNLAQFQSIPVADADSTDPAITSLFMRGFAVPVGSTPNDDKFAHYNHIRENLGYEVILQLGDNAADFSAEFHHRVPPNERRKAVATHAAKWGHCWIQLPNPVYGSFLQSLAASLPKVSVAEDEGSARTPSDLRVRLPRNVTTTPKMYFLDPWIDSPES